MAKSVITHTYQDTFFNRDDAYHWLDALIGEHGRDEWKMLEYKLCLIHTEAEGYLAAVHFRKR